MSTTTQYVSFILGFGGKLAIILQRLHVVLDTTFEEESLYSRYLVNSVAVKSVIFFL